MPYDLSSGHHFSQPICDLIVDYAFTRAHSSNVCMLSSYSEATNNWFGFIVKHPCRRVRVLEEDQCPPFGIDHDIRDYPAYYDPLYYPQFHASKFENARSFCCWLSEALTNHSQDCSRCLGWPLSNCVVTYDGVSVSIKKSRDIGSMPQVNHLWCHGRIWYRLPLHSWTRKV